MNRPYQRCIISRPSCKLRVSIIRPRSISFFSRGHASGKAFRSLVTGIEGNGPTEAGAFLKTFEKELLVYEENEQKREHAKMQV